MCYSWFVMDFFYFAPSVRFVLISNVQKKAQNNKLKKKQSATHTLTHIECSQHQHQSFALYTTIPILQPPEHFNNHTEEGKKLYHSNEYYVFIKKRKKPIFSAYEPIKWSVLQFSTIASPYQLQYQHHIPIQVYIDIPCISYIRIYNNKKHTHKIII